MIAKRDPLERVGNVVQVDGRLMVIEYSDLPEEAANLRNADGSLAIWAGSIAVHVIDTALRRLADDGGAAFRPARQTPSRAQCGPLHALPYRRRRKWLISTQRAGGSSRPSPTPSSSSGSFSI